MLDEARRRPFGKRSLHDRLAVVEGRKATRASSADFEWHHPVDSLAGVTDNWGLDLVKERLERQAAGEAVAVPWTLPTLRWEWNRAKPEAAPWWPENSKEAYSSGLDALARALSNFSASRAGRRVGRRSRASGRGGAGGSPAASRLGRSGWRPTVTTSRCRGWGGYRA